jgi:hypothetical protein
MALSVIRFPYGAHRGAPLSGQRHAFARYPQSPALLYSLSHSAYRYGRRTGLSLVAQSSPYLRSVPEAIIVVGDTAFIPLTYDPNTYAPDSLILSINLRTQQVDSFAKVYPNPAELVRIGGKLHAACYGDLLGTPAHL